LTLSYQDEEPVGPDEQDELDPAASDAEVLDSTLPSDPDYDTRDPEADNLPPARDDD
jgi:hypothetical protein